MRQLKQVWQRAGLWLGASFALVTPSPLCPQELSLLPLTEPTIMANFSLFAPFGSSPINGKSQLRGAFGSAVLDSVPDYYSQLLTKVRGGLFPGVPLTRGFWTILLFSPHRLPPEQPFKHIPNSHITVHSLQL